MGPKASLQILHGNASEVARGMRQSATKRGLTTEQRKAIDSCAGCLIKYKKMLRYDQYLSQGLPIATGVIEGACRSLVKDRMDVTGARWTLPGAEAVLKARSLRSAEISMLTGTITKRKSLNATIFQFKDL